MKKLLLLCLLALLPKLANAQAADVTEINGLYFDSFTNINASEGRCRFTTQWSDPGVNTHSIYSGDIVIPETVVHNGITYTVTTLGQNVFHNSTVNSVRIPKTITEIQDQYHATSVRTIVCAVDNPNNLKTTYVGHTITSADASRFQFHSQCRLIVPSASVSSYTANGWGTLCGGGIIGGTVIEANSKSMTYGDDVPELTWKCYSSDDNLQGSPALSCSATSQSPVGNYTITTSMNTLQSSDDITLRNNTLVINKAPLTIIAKSYSIKTGTDFPTYDCIFSGLKNNETRNVLTTQPTCTCTAIDTQTKGVYTITPKNAEAANYNISYMTGTLRIQDEQTMDLTAIPTMTYGDAAYTLPTQTNEGLSLTWSVANTDIAKVSGNTLTIKGAGNTTVTAHQAGNDTYEAFSKEFALTVNKATLTISAENKSKVYGDITPNYTVTYSGFKNGESSSILTNQPTITCSASKTSNVGTYNIIPSGATAANYNISYVNGTLTVNKAPLTITAKDYTVIQGHSLPAFEFTYSGFMNSETESVLTTAPTISCSATSSSAPGDYDITVNGATATNYSFNYVNGTLTIQENTGIVFADNNVKDICIANWDSNGDGELTKEEAAAVTTLGSKFYNTSITSFDELVHFTGLTKISGFNECKNLASITIPNSVTSIGNNAFYNCSGLTSVTIPNSVTSIGEGAFGSCSGLTSITIPNSVTSIGMYAFSYCSGLTSIAIPNSVTSFGGYAFANSGLTSITIPNSITTINYNAFENCTALTSVSIPNSVTSIGNYAFNGCINLTSISIPNSVTSIGMYAFSYCYGLTSVTIGRNVTTIGSSPFSSCTNLSSIVVTPENTSYDSRNNCNAIIETATNKLVQGCTSSTIPDGVTSIGNSAFRSLSSLTSITIPNSVETIGSYAFADAGLTSLTVYREVPVTIDYYVFQNVHNCTLYVPAGSVDAYKAANYWKSLNVTAISKTIQTLDYTAIPEKTYGDAAYLLPETTEEGLPLTWSVTNTDIATVSSNVLNIKNAGTTTVTASNEGDGDNEPFSKSFTLTVNKAPLIITASNTEMKYGDETPSYEITCTGFKNNESTSILTSLPTITCTASNTSNVGTYDIILSGASAANYDISYVNGILTINKAPLTITAKSYTINQKDNLPEFGVTYDGFKNDETSSVLTTLPTITCDATDSETAGDFDITPSGATAMNYSFNYVKGTLTVNEVESVTIAMKTGGGAARSMIAYSSKYGLDFTDRPELKAYIACGYNSKKEVMLVHVNVVPPYTGMVIKTTNGIYDGGEYDVPTTTEDYYYANLLVPVVETGTVTPTETIDDVEYTNFTIGTLVGGGIGFVKLTTNWTTHNKSYLRVPTSLYENTSYARAIRGFGVEFVEGEKATAILNAKRNTPENNGDYYDLQGRKVKPNRQGLYIHKGKKVFIK